MKELKKYIKYLEDCKELVGLEGWKIMVANTYVDMEAYATVEPDIYEKTMKITLGKKFEKTDKIRKNNILLHELVHAKICIYNQEIDELIKSREEHLVNDLTRGYEKLLNSK